MKINELLMRQSPSVSEAAPQSLQQQIQTLENQKIDLESNLAKVEKITTGIKYANEHMEIISQISTIYNELGIDERDYRSEMNDVFEAARNLESAVYSLEEPLKDKIRNLEYKIEQIQDEIDYPDEK